MNILISSAGRRVSLLKAFKNELKAFFKEGKVFCADNKPELSPACQLSDGSFRMPLLSDKNFINELLEISVKNNIKIIIPTIDTELSILTKNKELFLQNGISIIISDENLIKESFSKILTQKLFERVNIKYPKIYNKQNPSFPLISKPEFGSSGKNIFVVNNKSELTIKMIEDEEAIFFEYLNPKEFTEFTVDLYFDKNSNLKCLVPRERIEVRGGEVSKGVTRKNKLYNILKDKLKHIEGANGCITMQFFVSNTDDNNFYAIECNPRFGGGYPLSYLAGANYPKWLIQEYVFNQEIPFYEDWEENLLMLRYDSEVLVHGFNS